ncbi:aminotransferase class V-fold PLP-dependent enzyme [Bacillus aerolatus]|uniref:Aminotransferase class V-fold PLP-dependent enzyme n=1 Tax=Bacillus aerolatus TaxID=2653354 RepID=A0A6I1FIY8_9BACI|nr:cysteine desulfurase family protein [Bacillus aerolatus]KAB7705894.1 aminotransferase class V-fold PLP-dependent enzyme [Bacillus aerolatus]
MIYFDNSATTKPYKEALDTFVKVNEQFFGNPSSLHHLGIQAERLLTEARKQIASLMGAKSEEIIFTSGGTESNNLAIKGAAFANRHRGSHIITQQTEHPSVINACRQLEELGFQVTYLPVDSEGRVAVQEIAQALTDETIVVSIMHVNNETGTIQPVKEIAQLLQKHPKALFHVDDIQGRGKVELNLDGIDLCSLSAHKFHGLKGNGVLYKKKEVKLSSLLSGGNQESGWRSGTENAGGLAAMAKALRLTEEQRAEKGHVMKDIQLFLRTELEKMERTVIHTPEEGCAPHILNFSIAGIKGEVLIHALEEKGCYLSTTSACSSRQRKTSTVLTAMGLSKSAADSSIRLSLSYGNTIEEAKAFIRLLKETIPNLTKVQR